MSTRTGGSQPDPWEPGQAESSEVGEPHFKDDPERHRNVAMLAAVAKKRSAWLGGVLIREQATRNRSPSGIEMVSRSPDFKSQMWKHFTTLTKFTSSACGETENKIKSLNAERTEPFPSFFSLVNLVGW
jgi:hypothetical protein